MRRLVVLSRWSHSHFGKCLFILLYKLKCGCGDTLFYRTVVHLKFASLQLKHIENKEYSIIIVQLFHSIGQYESSKKPSGAQYRKRKKEKENEDKAAAKRFAQLLTNGKFIDSSETKWFMWIFKVFEVRRDIPGKQIEFTWQIMRQFRTSIFSNSMDYLLIYIFYLKL